MNEVCSKDSINWMKYGNFITTNNTHIYEERTILRNGNKNWFTIYFIIFYYFNNLKLIYYNDNNINIYCYWIIR